jgi:hypothetical protein
MMVLYVQNSTEYDKFLDADFSKKDSKFRLNEILIETDDKDETEDIR